jgi:hypothetical protein
MMQHSCRYTRHNEGVIQKHICKPKRWVLFFTAATVEFLTKNEFNMAFVH